MKKPVNLSIRGELMEEAREYKINLSATLEEAVEEKLREERAKRWREENKEAIESYNRHIEKHGTFSERLRRFR